MKRSLGFDPKELNAIIRALNQLPVQLQKDLKRKILREAAKPLVKAARGNIKDSDGVHHRYNTPKLNKRLRAPNGKGKKVATYYPGNLRRSIRVLPLRRTKNKVLVGPKVAKGRSKSGGRFQGRKVDGYYAHWYEFGTSKYPGRKFMRRAFESTRQTIVRKVATGVESSLKKYIRKKRVVSRT